MSRMPPFTRRVNVGRAATPVPACCPSPRNPGDLPPPGTYPCPECDYPEAFYVGDRGGPELVCPRCLDAMPEDFDPADLGDAVVAPPAYDPVDPTPAPHFGFPRVRGLRAKGGA